MRLRRDHKSNTLYVGPFAIRAQTWLSRVQGARAAGRAFSLYLDGPHLSLRAELYLRRIDPK